MCPAGWLRKFDFLAWHQAGALDIQARARIKVAEILSSPPQQHIPKEIEAALRQKYGIAEFEK